MRQRRVVAIIILFLVFTSLACTMGVASTAAPTNNLPTVPPEVDQQQTVDYAIQGTLLAQTQLAQYIEQTLTAMAPVDFQFTVTPSLTLDSSATLTPSATATHEAVSLTVSVETNCRSGPGPMYDVLGYL